jgi:hypothetical protein
MAAASTEAAVTAAFGFGGKNISNKPMRELCQAYTINQP